MRPAHVTLPPFDARSADVPPRLNPPPDRPDPSGRLYFHRDFRGRRSAPALVCGRRFGSARGFGDTLVRLFLSRSAARDAAARGLVVAPADGVVSAVGFAARRPNSASADEPLAAHFDFHVGLRLPRQSRADRRPLTQDRLQAGLFLNADLDKASEDNERNGLVIDHSDGRFGIVQIAGLVARRIVCFVHEGETIGAGDRFGLIRFGSRVDVYLPDNVTRARGCRSARNRR